MSADFKDYYQMLGVPVDATQNVIRKSYYKNALLLHPDKNITPDRQKVEAFNDIKEAWETLSDPSKRAEYNERRLGALAAADVRIADHVDIDELDYDETSGLYSYTCRCGGVYTTDDDMLNDGVDVVGCDGCSLYIKLILE